MRIVIVSKRTQHDDVAHVLCSGCACFFPLLFLLLVICSSSLFDFHFFSFLLLSSSSFSFPSSYSTSWSRSSFSTSLARYTASFLPETRSNAVRIGCTPPHPRERRSMTLTGICDVNGGEFTKRYY